MAFRGFVGLPGKGKGFFPGLEFKEPPKKFNVRDLFEAIARPGKAVANVVNEITFREGKDIPGAFVKGWQGKGIDPYKLGEKILDVAGIEKTPITKFTAGFLTSVGTDPITYIPFAKVGKFVGTAVKKLPLIDDAIRSVKNLPIIDKATGAIKTAFQVNAGFPDRIKSIINDKKWLNMGQETKVVKGVTKMLVEPYKKLPKLQQILATEIIERMSRGVGIDNAIKIAENSIKNITKAPVVITEPETIEFVKKVLKFKQATEARDAQIVIDIIGREKWKAMSPAQRNLALTSSNLPRRLEHNIGYLAHLINPEHTPLINKLYPNTRFQGLSYILSQPSLKNSLRRSSAYAEYSKRFLMEAEKMKPGFLERIGIKEPLVGNLKLSLSHLDKADIEIHKRIIRETKALGKENLAKLHEMKISPLPYVRYYTIAEINKKAAEGSLEFLTEFTKKINPKTGEIELIPIKRHAVKEFLVEDLPTIIAIRDLRSVRTATGHKILNEIAKQFGKTSDEIIKLAEGGQYFEHSKLIKNVLKKDLYFDREIAATLDKMGRVFSIAPEYQDMINYFDKIQGIWKWWTLVPIPSYHFRNAIGNIWLNYLAGVNPDSYRIAVDILRGKKGLVGVGKHTYEDLINAVATYGVRGRGELAIEGTLKTIKSELYGSVGKKIQSFGTLNEDLARIANFVDGIVYKGLTPAEARARTAKFLFDYSEITPTERNYFRRLFPFYCVSDDTECLTDNGWKFYYQITPADKLLTYNLETKNLEWQNHNGIFDFDYNGYLIHFSSHNLDLLCTPNHRCITVEYGIKEAIDIGYNNHCPMVGNNTNKDFAIDDRILSLIGWIITDGHYRRNGSDIVIYQKKYNAIIEKLLGDDYYVYIHPQTGVSQYGIKGKTRKEIQKWFHYGLWKLVIQLSKRQCNILKEAIFQAEGCEGYTNNSREYRFISQEGKYRDLLQLIWFLSGENCKLGERGFYIRKLQVAKYRNKKLEWFKGKVWCPSTPNTTAIFRRNGIITISGQTWLRKNIPLELEQMYKQTGKFTTIHHALKGIETDRPDTDFLPEWFHEQNPVFHGTDEKGRARAFFLSSYLPIYDIQKIMSFKNIGETLKSSLTPIIKAPLEFITNTSWFFNKAIERHPGQVSNVLGLNLPNRIKNLIRNVRIINELDKLNPGLWFGSEDVPGIFGVKKTQKIQPEFYARVLNVLSGLDFNVIDLEITKKKYLRQLNENIMYLQGMVKIYGRMGDETNKRIAENLLEKYRKHFAEVRVKPVYPPTLR